MNCSRRLFLKAAVAVSAISFCPAPIRRAFSFGDGGALLLYDREVDINAPVPEDWLAVIPLEIIADGRMRSGESQILKTGQALVAVRVSSNGTPLCSTLVGEGFAMSSTHVSSGQKISIVEWCEW